MKNQKGQGLIEYLVMVALIAIASIAIMKVLGQNIRGQMARITNALQGESAKPRLNKVSQGHHQQRDLGDFFEGAADDE